MTAAQKIAAIEEARRDAQAAKADHVRLGHSVLANNCREFVRECTRQIAALR